MTSRAVVVHSFPWCWRLEVGDGVLHGQARAAFRWHTIPCLLCPHLVEGLGVFWGLFTRALIYAVLALRASSPPKAHLLMPAPVLHRHILEGHRYLVNSNSLKLPQPKTGPGLIPQLPCPSGSFQE